MAVTGQCEDNGQFGIALVKYGSENNNGPATVTTASGAEFRRFLARWFNGDFHRMTCRSATNCNGDAHTGFRLSETALASGTRLGGSYLGPNSIRDAIFQAVILGPALSYHLDGFITLDERMDIGHQVVSRPNRDATRLKFFANLHDGGYINV